MLKIAISGCQGRMGQRIVHFVQEDDELTINTLLEHKDHPKANESINGINVTTNPDDIKGSDVFIDFTLPDGTAVNIDSCVKHGIKMVIGTTGLQSEQIEKIKQASQKIAIVFASNMSIGVNIVFKLTQLAAEKTAANYTMNMSESHHVHKKDAPSGTAKTIASIAEAASGQKVQDIKSIREGEIVGDHEIVFESEEDILTISHHAKSRDIFVKGALVAAKFLSDKTTGLYSMQDVLGLN